MPPNPEESIEKHIFVPIPKNVPPNNPDIRMMQLHNAGMEQKNIAPIKLLISEWTPTKTFYLKYGSYLVAMLPWTVTIPTASRTRAMLKNKTAMKKDLRIRPTPWSPPGLIPGMITIAASLMTEKLVRKYLEKTVIFDEIDCPLCIQLRAGNLQCFTGVFAPYILTVSAMTFSTFYIPLLAKEYGRKGKNLGEVINEIRKIGWKNRSIVGYSIVAQFALNMFYVSKFQSEWLTIQNILYEKSAIMNSSASFNNNS